MSIRRGCIGGVGVGRGRAYGVIHANLGNSRQLQATV